MSSLYPLKKGTCKDFEHINICREKEGVSQGCPTSVGNWKLWVFEGFPPILRTNIALHPLESAPRTRPELPHLPWDAGKVNPPVVWEADVGGVSLLGVCNIIPRSRELCPTLSNYFTCLLYHFDFMYRQLLRMVSRGNLHVTATLGPIGIIDHHEHHELHNYNLHKHY